MDVPLQPLRIPEGWRVQYNDLYEINPDSNITPEDDETWFFKEDLLQIMHPRLKRLLDVGWYPTGNLIDGSYMLVIYEGDFNGRLLHQFRTKSRLDLVAEIERLLMAISSRKL